MHNFKGVEDIHVYGFLGFDKKSDAYRLKLNIFSTMKAGQQQQWRWPTHYEFTTWILRVIFKTAKVFMFSLNMAGISCFIFIFIQDDAVATEPQSI